MAGVWLSQGIAAYQSSGLTIQAWLATLNCALFVNNIVPARGDNNGSYTEASFPGYARPATTAWTPIGIDGNGNYQYDASVNFVYTSTGPSGDTVYGYFLVDAFGATVIAEANGAPFAMTTAGLTYTVEGHFYLGQIDPPV